MRKHLVIQSIGPDRDDKFVPYMELQEPIHRSWCENMGADYLFHRGAVANAHPTWNRFPLILEAFDRGYEKAVWMDADVLVVKQHRDIFAETPDDVPLLMTRVFSSAVSVPWKDERFIDPAERKWDLYNDGVMVVNNLPQARSAIEWAWARRRDPQEPWHVQGQMWELNWLLDYVYDNPESVGILDFIWNWQPFGWAYSTAGQVGHGPTIDEACILAWHGTPALDRWRDFRAAYEQHYGHR